MSKEEKKHLLDFSTAVAKQNKRRKTEAPQKALLILPNSSVTPRGTGITPAFSKKRKQEILKELEEIINELKNNKPLA